MFCSHLKIHPAPVQSNELEISLVLRTKWAGQITIRKQNLSVCVCVLAKLSPVVHHINTHYTSEFCTCI